MVFRTQVQDPEEPLVQEEADRGQAGDLGALLENSELWSKAAGNKQRPHVSAHETNSS